MSHSKTKFNNSWLKKKDSNGHLLEWWCKSHDSDKFKAVCKLCDKEIQVANNGCFALVTSTVFESKDEPTQKQSFTIIYFITYKKTIHFKLICKNVHS